MRNVAKVIEVIENNGDTYLKHANGILEIFFSRVLDFTINTPGILVSSGDIEPPKYVTLIKGIHANVTIEANGTDITLAGTNLDSFRAECKLHRIYAYTKYDSAVYAKKVNFHLIGKWK